VEPPTGTKSSCREPGGWVPLVIFVLAVVLSADYHLVTISSFVGGTPFSELLGTSSEFTGVPDGVR
jgi:hypothetical protein